MTECCAVRGAAAAPGSAPMRALGALGARRLKRRLIGRAAALRALRAPRVLIAFARGLAAADAGRGGPRLRCERRHKRKIIFAGRCYVYILVPRSAPTRPPYRFLLVVSPRVPAGKCFSRSFSVYHRTHVFIFKFSLALCPLHLKNCVFHVNNLESRTKAAPQRC